MAGIIVADGVYRKCVNIKRIRQQSTEGKTILKINKKTDCSDRESVEKKDHSYKMKLFCQLNLKEEEILCNVLVCFLLL